MNDRSHGEGDDRGGRGEFLQRRRENQGRDREPDRAERAHEPHAHEAKLTIDGGSRVRKPHRQRLTAPARSQDQEHDPTERTEENEQPAGADPVDGLFNAQLAVGRRASPRTPLIAKPSPSRAGPILPA